MENKKPKFFELRRIPMDLGRLVLSPALLGFRIQKRNSGGGKYKSKLKGNAIIVANHVSLFDPFVMGCAFWYRRMFFLASEKVMGSPIKNFLLTQAGCIKIDRNISDIEAIRKASDILKEGRVLTVFPQGEIKEAGAVAQVKAGAVLLSLQTGAPIIPVYSQKRSHFWQRRLVVIGQPLNPKSMTDKKFPSMADINRISEAVLGAIEECRQQFENEVNNG